MTRRIIVDELEFEVPYGKLAAKSWHEETEESKRILVLHGWMDNAGSFDKLVPLIKHRDDLYVVALDLPGHGKSSQLPPGSSYSDLNMLMEIRRCVLELQWNQVVPKQNKDINGIGAKAEPLNKSSDTLDSHRGGVLEERKKFSIIGHSLGAGLALFYASLFPDDVDEVISLDFIKARTPPVEVLLKNTADSVDSFIETVPSQSSFPSPSVVRSTPQKSIDKGQVIVSQETAIIATIEAHKQLGDLTREDAKCLLKRSTVAVSSPPNCVIYSRDLRLQTMLNFRENLQIQQVMFSRIKCHVLVIFGKNGMYTRDELFRDKIDEVEAFYRERAQSLHLQWIDGDHYLHLNKPEQTAEIISKYLESPENYDPK